MSVERSPNCTAYTDYVSTLVELKASDPSDPRCTARSFAFSCQPSAFEAPDDATAEFMKAQAMETLQGCDDSSMTFEFKTNFMGARDQEYSPERLSELGLASNCNLTGNDPNLATHKIVAKCNPMFDMTDSDGNRVRNFNMTFGSSLGACDVSDSAVPQLYEDARKLAAYNAEQAGWKVDDPKHLACSYRILPHL